MGSVGSRGFICNNGLWRYQGKNLWEGLCGYTNEYSTFLSPIPKKWACLPNRPVLFVQSANSGDPVTFLFIFIFIFIYFPSHVYLPLTNV
jgi:hypothetical protein